MSIFAHKLEILIALIITAVSLGASGRLLAQAQPDFL